MPHYAAGLWWSLCKLFLSSTPLFVVMQSLLVMSLSICTHFGPHVTLPNILPSVMSSSGESCFMMCPVQLSLQCYMVSKVFLFSWTFQWLLFYLDSRRLFVADGPAAEKLRGMKPTILVLGVTKSLTSADCALHTLTLLVLGWSSSRGTMGWAGAGIFKPVKCLKVELSGALVVVTFVHFVKNWSHASETFHLLCMSMSQNTG